MLPKHTSTFVLGDRGFIYQNGGGEDVKVRSGLSNL